MPIIGTGINYSTGAPLFEFIEEKIFIKEILESLRQNAEEIQSLTRASLVSKVFLGEMERSVLDFGDPITAGWTYLVNEDNPNFDEIIQIIQPLAEHRGMKDPKAPLIFHNESPDEWIDWLQENYFAPELEMKKVPHYILIVGGPDLIPFHFQPLLDSAASVGRIDFDSMEDLKTYINKIIHLEKAPSPIVSRDTIVFATNHGVDARGRFDATYFSHHYMAKPLADHIRNQCGFNTHSIMADDATKVNLLEILRKFKPALIFTASHGLAAPNESIELQKQLNGAICCHQIDIEPIDQRLFTANDVPINEPFLEGSIFFQFACFGYGTPAESDFMHWFNNPTLNTKEDFIAALPKILLAHPRGPLAFIGHVDTAWLHGFDDPNNPHILERWHPRIAPFVKIINMLLAVQPIGLAMADMNKRYDLGNAQLTSIFDRLKRGKIQMTEDFQIRLANAFIHRSDAQNYMVFGDPAVRLRIPS